RTRLTHTLEVAQISRTIARQLGLNEDLTETIALAHDLGHPPFGHAGEQALDECMRGHGGFEHNRHGLRIVEALEHRYADCRGRLGPLQFQPAVVRDLIDWQVTDLLHHTRERLRQARVRSVEDVRNAPDLFVGPGPEVRQLKAGLEAFLHERVYRHYRVMRM